MYICSTRTHVAHIMQREDTCIALFFSPSQKEAHNVPFFLFFLSSKYSSTYSSTSIERDAQNAHVSCPPFLIFLIFFIFFPFLFPHIQVRLGTLEQKEAQNEYVYRPFLSNSKTKDLL
jgi:hypothetical protein